MPTQSRLLNRFVLLFSHLEGHAKGEGPHRDDRVLLDALGSASQSIRAVRMQLRLNCGDVNNRHHNNAEEGYNEP
jgi:hypothetical protein